MKTILFLFAAFFGLPALQAELVIYKHNISITRTGGGATTKSKTTGWTLLDSINAPETNALAIVAVDDVRRTFIVEKPVTTNDFEIQSLDAGTAKTYTVLAIYGGGFRGMTIKGLNRAIRTTSGTNTTPRTASVSGSDVFRFSEDGPPIFDEYKGNATFDLPRTQAAKTETLDMDQSIQKIREFLIAKGYTEN